LISQNTFTKVIKDVFMYFKVVRAATAVLCLAGAISPIAHAATTVASYDNGWILKDIPYALAFPDNTNTITGRVGESVYRSYYLFDLAGVTSASAISVTFLGNNGLFYSDNGTETLGLFDFTGPVDTLENAENNMSNISANFADLGSGSQLGSYTLTQASGTLMPEFTIALSQSFVDQFNATINSQDKRIALGVSMQTISSQSTLEAFWSGSGKVPAARLNIGTQMAAVPEPATWIFMLLGFAGMGYSMRRNAKLKLHTQFT
jgi:PEP-CTERM motif